MSGVKDENQASPAAEAGYSIWSMVESVGKQVSSFVGIEEGKDENEAMNSAELPEGVADGRIPDSEDTKSFWSQLKDLVGSDVTSLVSVPVFVMEPTSVLQKMAEIMEYPELLEKAAKCDEPVQRMAWVTAFALSVYPSVERTWKPFNPILGETFQIPLGDDGMYLAEQVSHHPPIGVAHAETSYWEYDIVSHPKTKFHGNTIDIFPIGRTRIRLKATHETYNIQPPYVKVHNLLVGKMWVDQFGDLVLHNGDSGWKSILSFIPYSYFGTEERYTVRGHVYNPEGDKVLALEGRWNAWLEQTPCDKEGSALAGAKTTRIWQAHAKPPPEKVDKYGFTDFVHNTLNGYPKGVDILPSDSRLRPDRVALGKGRSGEAQRQKHRLEEMQRAEKKERARVGDTWEPKWFEPGEPVSVLIDGDADETDCPSWDFVRFPEKKDGTRPMPEDFEDKANELFNPWQYPSIHQ